MHRYGSLSNNSEERPKDTELLLRPVTATFMPDKEARAPDHSALFAFAAENHYFGSAARQSIA